MCARLISRPCVSVFLLAFHKCRQTEREKKRERVAVVMLGTML